PLMSPGRACCTLPRPVSGSPAPGPAAARLKPGNPRPVAYGKKYFGPGPDSPGSADGSAGWAAWPAGGAGTALLIAAAVVVRRERRPRAGG
ncbi:hypothetical protein ACFWN1_32350, partial [Streptomyces sp. NPDC058459]